MKTSQGLKSISEEDALRYQRRLAHYLKNFRYRNKLLAKEVAEQLGYSPVRFSDLESAERPQGRFANALDFLSTLASLENHNLQDFVGYLSGQPDRASDDSGIMAKWEESLLEAFDGVSLKTRKAFLGICKKDDVQARKRLDLLLQLCVAAKDLPEESVEDFISAFSRLEGVP